MASIYKRRPDFIGIAVLGAFLIGLLGLTVHAVHSNASDKMLITAIQEGNLKSMAAALQNGADVNANHGAVLMTAIGTALDAKHKQQTIEFLFTNGYDKKAAFADGGYIDAVIMQNDTPTLEYLLKQGATFRTKSDKMQDSALHNAIRMGTPTKSGQSSCAVALLDHGADPNDKDRSGMSLLDSAIQQQQDDMIVALLKHGVIVEPKTAEALLLYGGDKNNLAFVKAALENGADANVTDKISGATTLHTAVIHKNKEMVDLLLRSYADVNMGDGKQPPIFYAVSQGDTEIVRLLLEKGADTKRITGLVSLGRTNGTLELVNMLLAKGATD